MKTPAQMFAAPKPGKTAGPKLKFLAATLSGVFLAAAFGPVEAANKSKVSVYQHGKPVGTLPCESIPGSLPRSNPLFSRTAVLMGGGLDVKEALSWMITKMARCADGSTGAPGNFVVIRVGGNPAYDSFIYKLGTVASVVTLVVPNREVAMDPENVPIFATYIQNAGAIWLTGGDQGDYYTFWKGTPLESLISAQTRNFGIPIGGTSAGMMILSQINYTAIPATITSPEALLDPYKNWLQPEEAPLDLVADFWTNNQSPFPPLMSMVTDSHFQNRDRMGRLISFLGRTIAENKADSTVAQAIGVDQETALLMECEDMACSTPPVIKAVSNPKSFGAAYILKPSANSSLTVAPATPLTFTNVEVKKFQANSAPTTYKINVNNGVMTSTNANASIY